MQQKQESNRASVTPPSLTDAVIDAIQDKKGRDITLIDLSALEAANASQYIICTGGTPTQVSAVADNVREMVQKQTGEKPINYQGYRNSTWIIIDYGSVMVHIFVPDARNFYNIEQLWSDGVISKIDNVD